MERSKKVVFISHCILNQNTVVEPLARAKGAYRDIIRTIMDSGVGIHQLPCPEYRHLGLKRKPMSKEEYDTEEFRNLCKNISQDTIQIMKEYKESDYNIIGIIGINHSPSCSINGSKGILMEELFRSLDDAGIILDKIDVSVDYSDDKDNTKEIEQLKEFLS